MKRLAILGSTGSIGVSTMKVVKAFEGQFEVVAIAAGRNADLVEEQMLTHRPRVALRVLSLRNVGVTLDPNHQGLANGVHG